MTTNKEDNAADWERKYVLLKERHDKLKKALDIGKQTQQAMLPRIQPNFPGYEIHAFMNSKHEISGDYYSFNELGKNKLGVIIADVAGKGLEAGFITPYIKGGMDMALGLGIKNHAEVIKQLNTGLYNNTLPDKFVTYISGALTEKMFKYINAGHETPLLYSEGEIKGINRNLRARGTNNTVLGAMPGIDYEAFSVNLKKGDILFLYSDGIGESLGERKSRREGMVNLGKIIKQFHSLRSEEISDKLHGFLKEYIRKDDQTTIVIKKVA